MNIDTIDIEKIKELSISAGEVIMRVYESPDIGIERKDDDSPLTKADLASSEVISSGLRGLYPEIPIISEEEVSAPYEKRKDWKQFWCVDPLDGTKEFIKKNGEFTVNIALMECGVPVLGVVYAPVLGEMYWSDGKSSWREVGGKKERIKASHPKDKFVLVGSRSHQTPDLLEFMEQKRQEYGEVELISRGSSLKICMVAEGSAHAYYRGGPTMEWDTAAGHAVVRTAGANLTQIDGVPFVYNKENLLNPGFIVCAKI